MRHAQHGRTRAGMRIPAAVWCVAILVGIIGGMWGGPAATTFTSAQEASPSPCEVRPDKVAEPTVLEDLGERTRITLSLEEVCPAELAPVDVMLVLDKSNSMNEPTASNGKTKLDNVKAAAIAFVDEMDLTQSRVGLVAFNHQVGLRSALTADGVRIKSSIRSLRGDGQTNVTDAIRLANQHFDEASDPGRARAMIVLTDGIHNATPESPLVSAQEAKAAGIDVITFCAGDAGDCDPSLEAAASDPSRYFLVEDTAGLVALYTQLATELQQNAIVSLTVRDLIPRNMRYITGSAVPPVDEVNVDPGSGETELVWRIAGGMPVAGLSYELEPLERGTHPTNVVAVGEFVDRLGLTGSTEFPVPSVFIPDPTCPPRGLEIYFLIDDSTCLLNSQLNGMLALEAIAQGISRNLDELQLGRDRVAVIGFGDRARVYTSLTSDRAQIMDAVRRVAMLDRSARLDLAYNEARKIIADSPLHRDDAQIVTVAVTDGPMMAAPQRAMMRADQLRSQNDALNYVIGVGPIVQHTLLRQMAEPGGYRSLPLGGDVIDAYESLGDMWIPLGLDCLPAAPPATATPTPTPEPPDEGSRIVLPLLQRHYER